LKTEKDFNLKERCLKAFLDLIILRLLTEQPMTGYRINRHIIKKFGVITAPNTINTKLTSLERSGHIHRFKNSHGKTFSLTDKGKQTANNMPGMAAEIHAATKTMLGS
jgi:DNA-binding PadR family transcriptional regulator